jgi:hypothetical protein
VGGRFPTPAAPPCPSDGDAPAVDRQDRAVHDGRRIGREERDGLGDLVSGPGATGRSGGGELVERLATRPGRGRRRRPGRRRSAWSASFLTAQRLVVDAS